MKVGITFSYFDLSKARSELMLKAAKKQCDYLIVGLKLDPSIDSSNNKVPSQSIIDSYIQLKGSKYIDEIIPYVTEQDVEDILLSFKLDVCIINKQYKTIDSIVKDNCLKKGIEIYYN
jgi:glycerol-3-phosphate cytidylyltransferase